MTNDSTQTFLEQAKIHLEKFSKQCWVIKLGGSLLEEESSLNLLLKSLVFLHQQDIFPILVHGGGNSISKALKLAGVQTHTHQGLRITCKESIKIVEQQLSFVINPELVEKIRNFGGKSVGILGTEVFTGKILSLEDGVDLGRVGTVTAVDKKAFANLHEVIPVISPLATQVDHPLPLNINADMVAAKLAESLGVDRLIYLSDVPGILTDKDNLKTLISIINPQEVRELIHSGVITAGMIPKVQSALEALQSGVNCVKFIDGIIPNALIKDILTPKGIGTSILLN